MRTVGHWVGQVRGMARHFTSGIETMIREAELEEMEKHWREENERIMRDCIPPMPHYPEPGQPDEMPPVDAEPTLPLEAAARRAAAREAAAAVKDIDDTKQPLLEHLIELRRRLLWSLATLVVAFFVCLYFAQDIFAVLVQPLLSGRAGQAHLHRHFRGLLRRGEGGAVRGADAELPGDRDPAVAVRRAGPLRQGKEGASCRSC